MARMTGGEVLVQSLYREGIRVVFHVKGAAEAEKLAALVRQSQSRSAVYDVLTNPTAVTVTFALPDAAPGVVVLSLADVMPVHVSSLSTTFGSGWPLLLLG